jgi:hypothetical protein
MKKVSTAAAQPSRIFFSAEAHHRVGSGRSQQLVSCNG